MLALAQLRKGEDLSMDEKKNYLGNLKKINYILAHIIPPLKLKTLIKYCRKDLAFEPEVAKYTGSPRQDFANMFQSRLPKKDSFFFQFKKSLHNTIFPSFGNQQHTNPQ